MAYEILSCKDKRTEYDGYKGRSYYENQFEGDTEGQEKENGEEGGGKQSGIKYRKKYTGFEWYLMTPSQLMFWGCVAVVVENLYESWHLRQLKRLRELAHQEHV